VKQSTKELGRVLPDRIRLLASLIARKPAQYTPEWAKTIDEAFSLYTRTSTINLFHQTNRLLIDLDWPFPAFIDLTEEQTRSARHGSLQSLTGRMVQASEVREIGITMTALIACLGGTNGSHFFDAAMVDLFDQHCDRVFGFLQNSPILQTKSQIVSDIKAAYRGRLCAATITAIVPLLDHIVREYFGARRLNVTIQVLRDAFMREPDYARKTSCLVRRSGTVRKTRQAETPLLSRSKKIFASQECSSPRSLNSLIDTTNGTRQPRRRHALR
jgi:hypothetical protein